MSGEIASSDDRPRASTSKDGAEPRTSVSTTAVHDNATMTDGLPTTSNPADLQRDVTPGSGSSNGNVLMEPTSSLDKLQTYLPTGTWAMYTALQTWAFSLRPNDAPTSPLSNCNSHQRIALIIVLGLSGFFAFISSFVKRFVYDNTGVHVLYPAPNLFSVAYSFTDPVTGVRFPCRTKEMRYCWPLTDDVGELKYDEKASRLRVLVFKPGIELHVRRKIWFKRVWDSWLDRADYVPEAPRLVTSSPAPKHFSLSSNITKIPETPTVLISPTALRNPASTSCIDDVVRTAPPLQPRWTHTLLGTYGSRAYLDLRPRVWAHGLVSVFAFATLALFSTQVTGCVFPSIPDYLPPTVQTGMLILFSFIAALFIRDDAVSLGQPMPQHVTLRSNGKAEEIPPYLRAVVDTLVWVRRQDMAADK